MEQVSKPSAQKASSNKTIVAAKFVPNTFELRVGSQLLTANCANYSDIKPKHKAVQMLIAYQENSTILKPDKTSNKRPIVTIKVES